MSTILPTIQIKKFVHRDAIQIGFVYLYNREIKSSLKQLRELRYTKTHGYWYIPYSKEAWRAFKELKIPYTIIEQSGTTTALPPKRDTTDIVESSSTTLAPASGDYKQANIANVANTNSQTKQVRNVRYHHKKFYVTIPYKQKDVEFLGNLKGAWWSKQYNNWVVKATLQNLEVLQGRFEFWDDETYSKLQTFNDSEISTRSWDIKVFAIGNDGNGNLVIGAAVSYKGEVRPQGYLKIDLDKKTAPQNWFWQNLAAGNLYNVGDNWSYVGITNWYEYRLRLNFKNQGPGCCFGATYEFILQ